MNRVNSVLVVILASLLLSVFSASASECNLNVAVSLHPYYSWLKNITGDVATVTPLIPSGSDPHSYQPVPADIKHLEKQDIIIINGLGHDEFVRPMLKAYDNKKNLEIIDTSKGLPLIQSASRKYGQENDKKIKSFNSHTYISIIGAVQQIQMIARKLGRMCPARAGEFNKNARAYAARMRHMLSTAIARIDEIEGDEVGIATVHDGYAYLLQELGIKTSAVVQPRHGIKPSGRQLQDTIKRIKRAKVKILFAELDYQKKYVDIIFQETGCRIYRLSHVSKGEYTKDFFEQAMQQNLNTIVQALTEAANDG